jgi:putative hydrolase of the HAD superfamily
MKGYFPDYYAVLKDICTTAQLDIDDSLFKILNDQRLSAKKQPYQTVTAQIIEMLQALKTGGYKIGLVSNCSGEETEGLFLCPLASLLDEIVLSYQEGVSKPQQAIYQRACDRLGVMPSEAIFIGDGGAGELAGAEKVGIKAFRATWFYDRQPYDDFPCLNNPIDVLDLVNKLVTH